MPTPATAAVLIQSVNGCSRAPVPVVSAVYSSALLWAWSSSMMLAEELSPC